MSISSKNEFQRSESNILLFGLIFSLLLGAFVRFVHVLPLGYPLNDGGFFFALIQDLQHSNSFLPTFASYNQIDIPFAYPPLSIYVTSFLWRSLSVSLFDLIRILPPIISCLTIAAFFTLARRLLPSSTQVIAATMAFTLLPTAFDWLIVGAGLTRAPGYLFAILTFIQIQSLYTTNNKQHILLAILFASLTILSHPGTAWFAFYSGGVLFGYSILTQTQTRPRYMPPDTGGSNIIPPRIGGLGGQRKSNITKSTLVVLGTAILTAPWWGTLIHRHGLGALLYPYQTESFSITALITPFSLLFTNEPLVDILAVIGFLGFLICLRERRYLLPLWLVAVFVFEPRLSAVYAAIPMAMLVGIGIDKAILPLVRRQGSKDQHTGKLAKITLGFLLLYALISAYLAPQYHSLSQDQVNSMDWIKLNTSNNSQFILLTGRESYGNDYTSEWFPALTERYSLTTPQGHEWLPESEFSRRVSLHAELQTYLSTEVTNLENWAQDNRLTFTHIYIAKKALRENGVPFERINESIENSPNYVLLFHNNDALLYEKKP